MEKRREMCEHKGMGHPDTLTDAACEAVALDLIRQYETAFGACLHFNVDKGLLVGGRSEPKLIVCGRASNPQGKLDMAAIVLGAARRWLDENIAGGSALFELLRRRLCAIVGARGQGAAPRRGAARRGIARGISRRGPGFQSHGTSRRVGDEVHGRARDGGQARSQRRGLLRGQGRRAQALESGDRAARPRLEVSSCFQLRRRRSAGVSRRAAVATGLRVKAAVLALYAPRFGRAGAGTGGPLRIGRAPGKHSNGCNRYQREDRFHIASSLKIGLLSARLFDPRQYQYRRRRA